MGGFLSIFFLKIPVWLVCYVHGVHELYTVRDMLYILLLCRLNKFEYVYSLSAAGGG